MFRQPKSKRQSLVLSTRVRPSMSRDIEREARRREIPKAEEVRRRLEVYAAHKQALEPPAADQQPIATA